MTTSDTTSKALTATAPPAAATSMALVPAPPTAISVVVCDHKAMLESYHAGSDASLKAAEGVDALKPRGACFPVRVEKITPTEGGEGEPSVCITATVGSLKNCRGGDFAVGDGFILLPVTMGKNATDEHLSGIKAYDGTQLNYKLIAEGSRINLFCPAANATSATRKGTMFVIYASPTWTIRVPKPKRTDATNPAGGAGAGGFRGAGRGRPRGAITDRPHQPKSFISNMPRSLAPFTEGSATGVAAAPLAPPQQASATAPRIDIDDEDVEDGTPEAVKKLAAAMPPPTPYSGGYLRDELKIAYARADSTLTPEQRMRLHYEFLELTEPFTVPAPLFDRGYRMSVSINCAEIVPAQAQDYAGQTAADTFALFHERPELETVVTCEMLRDPECPLMAISLRPSDVFGPIVESRLCDAHCKVPILAKRRFDNKYKIVQGQRKSPWLSRLPSTGATNATFSVHVDVEAWKPGTAFSDGPRDHSVVHAHAYSELLIPTFGITNTDAWDKLAEMIVENTEMWMFGTTDEAKTARLRFNAEHRGTPTSAEALIRIEDLIVDFGGALRERIGIPITLAKAAEFLELPLPTEKAKADARLENLRPVTCLTSNKMMFLESVVAGCEYYALAPTALLAPTADHPSPDIKLGELGPEVGTALFTRDWYDPKKSVTIEDASKVLVHDASPPTDAAHPLGVGKFAIDGRHDIRINTAQAKDLLQEQVLKVLQVFAVRPTQKSSGERAARALDVFYNGGNYDDFGMPLLESKALVLVTPHPPSSSSDAAPVAAVAPQPSVVPAPTAPSQPPAAAGLDVDMDENDDAGDPYAAAAVAPPKSAAKLPVSDLRKRSRSRSPAPPAKTSASDAADAARAKPPPRKMAKPAK